MPGTGGVPGDAVTRRAQNARLQMPLEDKDAQIAAPKTQNAELLAAARFPAVRPQAFAQP